jgi:DNA-binding transcriptional regulator YhcF (GntR family)
MKWQFKPGLPIYQQLVSIMKNSIANGTYPAGAKLPPVREIAMEAGVNPNTMQRAFATLEQEGLLYSVRTSGRFVTEDQNMLNNLRKDLSGDYIRELVSQLTQLGMSREEILAAVSEWIQKEDK